MTWSSGNMVCGYNAAATTLASPSGSKARREEDVLSVALRRRDDLVDRALHLASTYLDCTALRGTHMHTRRLPGGAAAPVEVAGGHVHAHPE